ncbi:MAG: flagellar basal-body rod protein FlgC, partial [Alphaproteobacteria bacterium]|nr:flagellar basal-body rod protein FlgC [Alphaproteobacteria bacterium]
MDFLKSISIAASGLRAQAGRMRILSENIANADSTASAPNADPYRRKIPTFRSEMDRALDARVVELGRVTTDQTAFRSKYEPGHPAADANGNVKYPNVNSLIEMTDMREAQRSYEANINVIGATRR